jgi:hypothetical protein
VNKSKLAYRIYVILIANKELKKKKNFEVSNRLAALEDLDAGMVINSAWKTI